MNHRAFDVTYPRHWTSCVVFASPHSGRDYPWSMMRASILGDQAIRSSEDAFVDALFASAPEQGAPLLAARMPRAFVDLNRSPEELDPALIEGVRRQGHNPRVASGLGVIPRVVANGRAIYRGKLSLEEVRARLEGVWQPYHDKLRELLETARAVHGRSVLIDCHSMPHEAVESVTRSGSRRPDVVLGDRFGAAAAANVVDAVEAAFTAEGFAVARNAPFAGAYITQAYGRPANGRHAVQVEIDRALYMDEKRIARSKSFNDVERALQRVIARLVRIGDQQVPLAAE